MSISESIPWPPLIRKIGVFDYDKLYKSLTEWGQNRQYKIMEDNYVSKDSGGGKEVEHKFTLKKKVNNFIQYKLTIDLHGWDVKPIEIKTSDGNSTRKVSGRMEIKIQGEMVFDWQNKWESSWFWKRLREFYIRYILRLRPWLFEFDSLYYEMYNLHALFKEVLGLEGRGNVYPG